MPVNPIGCGPVPERASGLALFWAERDPGRTVIRSDASQVSYGQLAHSIASTSATLAGQGLTAGDRLLIVCENSTAAVVLFLASLEMGIIPSIANARLSAPELAKIEGNARPRRTIYLASSSPDAARHAANVTTTRIADELWGDADLGPAYPPADTGSLGEARARDVACIAHTTGTTGSPKGVALSHSSLIHMGRLSAPPNLTGDQAHYYLIAPLAHIIGLGSNFMAALWSGASMELVARFDVNHMIEAIGSRGITNVMCVPTIYAAILSAARQRGITRIPNRLQSIRSGGAPLNVALKAEIGALMGLPLESGYGMTECNAIARTYAGACPVGSIGRPNEGVEVRILHSEEARVGGKDVGRLLVKSPCMAVGLWQSGHLTDLPELVDGWLDTGDLARIDADGNLFLVGRTKEIIIRSGFNVAPAEVEQVVCMHESVSACAVVGRAGLYDEIEIVAFVVLKPGAAPVDESELERHCKARLAGYKRPSRFLFVEAIPLLPNGKVDRQTLALSAAAQARSPQ